MTLQDLWTVVMRDTGNPVVPYDCNPESDDEGMLVYLSRRAAEMSAVHQSDLYDLDCEARRLDKVGERENCATCGCATGKAGYGDDSIGYLDGTIGPLCDGCNDRLVLEVGCDSGMYDEIDRLKRQRDSAWALLRGVEQDTVKRWNIAKYMIPEDAAEYRAYAVRLDKLEAEEV